MRTIFLICLFISSAAAANIAGFLGGSPPAVGGGGVVLKDTVGGIGGTSQAVGNNTANTYIAGEWAAGSSYSLTRVDIELKKNNTPAGNVIAYIYSENSGQPGTLMATCTNTFTASTLTSSFVYYQFDFPSTALSSGVSYFVVLKRSVAVDSTHYVIWSETTSGGLGVSKGDATPTWSDVGALYRVRFNTYGE